MRKKNSFIIELIKSPPFIFFIVLAAIIVIGMMIANHREKVVQMKEDVLYIQPKPSE
ncbi:MAG: hypothetical protein MUF36_11430 [Bacteroidales bacterium]|jgi:hypothetical protein|nr:hypothetical protein [Bacteroidales bacterium]